MIPLEPTLRRAQAELIDVRLSFVANTEGLDIAARAMLGLSFVLACMPCQQRALPPAPEASS